MSFNDFLKKLEDVPAIGSSWMSGVGSVEVQEPVLDLRLRFALFLYKNFQKYKPKKPDGFLISNFRRDGASEEAARRTLEMSEKFGYDETKVLEEVLKAPAEKEPLPQFKYHPDPIATGSIESSGKTCVCCGQARGYIYVGPVFAREELDEMLCPWCIANGEAARKNKATFTDDESIVGELPEAVVEELVKRTPGFNGWQQEQWLTHCGDAAAFLGACGRRELEAHGDKAVAAVRDAVGLAGEEWDRFYRALRAEGSPRAYLFRCLHCGTFKAYADSA